MKRYAALTLLLCLALFAGCAETLTPAPTPEPTPAAVEPQTPATPPEELIEPLYTRLSEERIEALAPRDDYGSLHPFAGELSYDANGAMEYKYGLFDSHGRIVCDPVYRSVSRLAARSGFFNADYIPMLGLWRKTSANPLCTIASLDGSVLFTEESHFAAGGTWDSIWNGLRVISNEQWCVYAEPWGEEVFRYPVEVTEDLRGTGFDPVSDTDI